MRGPEASEPLGSQRGDTSWRTCQSPGPVPEHAYVHARLQVGWQVAGILAELIFGGSLASVPIKNREHEGNRGDAASPGA